MKAVFEFECYREYLRECLHSPSSKRGLQAQYAKAMGCQAAYLSQVLKGRAELTEDHAIKLAIYLSLTPLASEYFVLLVRIARSSTPEARTYLNNHRRDLLQKSRETQSRLKSLSQNLDPELLQQYFASSVPSTVHVATSSQNFQTLESIAKRLRLPEEKVLETLQFLQDIEMVESDNGSWLYKGAPIHFSRRSPLNSTHQIVRRHQAIRSIEESDPEDIHFSSIFTISPETFADLRADLLDYIEASHKKIHASGTNEIYSLCLDLFRAV